MGVWALSAAVGLLASLGAWAEAPPYVLHVGTEGVAIESALGNHVSPLVRGLRYEANDDQGLAFRTAQVKTMAPLPDGGRHVEFVLEGPGAAQAAVVADVLSRSRHVLLRWTIKYEGPERKWNGWTTGFRFDFAAPAESVRTSSTIRYVTPTGAQDWEVKGDTPYQDFEWQMREMSFPEGRLVAATDWYDPDWIYGNNRDRAPFCRAGLPGKPPCEATYRMALFVLPKREAPPDELLAAQAGDRPLALVVHGDHLVAPGEDARFALGVMGARPEKQAGRLRWDVWDYYGRRLTQGDERFAVDAGDLKVYDWRIKRPQRGMLFLAAELSWAGGSWIERTNFAVLPMRPATAPRADSPFGMAAIIANPETYPDQPDMPTVLSLMQRIGVRWIRGGWFPLKDNPTDEDEQRVRARLDLLHQHGILPHVQLGSGVPSKEELPAFQQRLRQCVERFQFVSPYIEVGNELNASVKAPEYITGLLKPVHEVMRAAGPANGETLRSAQGDRLRVMSMGLGGVQKEWLDAFGQAGGMDVIDVLSVHPGCHPRAPEFWEGWRGWVFRPQMLDACKAAREHGGKQVWITEAYAPATPHRSQLDVRTAADYLVRTYVCSLALGVKVIEWYQFQDGTWFARRPNPTDGEYSFGVVYTDLTPKPQYVAFGVMTEQLEGARYVGRLDLGADDLYGGRFERPDGLVDVLWSYREKHETDIPWWPPEQYKDKSRLPGEPWEERWKHPVSVDLPAAAAVTVTDLMGNPRKLQPDGGKVKLALTGSPIYVRGLGAIAVRDTFWGDIP
jgi:hypothetical protein